jgi:DNA-binding transcriptional ArsR family regulator
MRRSRLLPPPSEAQIADPFSKKGALALFWLLARQGSGGEDAFAINRAAREVGVGPFTVYRAIRALEFDGIVRPEGMGTKKRFRLAKPKALLIRWLRHYQIQRKCRLHRYGLSEPRKLKAQESSVVPALHTATRSIFHAGVTNLPGAEYYLLGARDSVARTLGLIPQERGYDVLLIEPYYRGVVERYAQDRQDSTWQSALAVLTFLDLYHFPVRGREQAEAHYRKVPALKALGPWSDIESVEAW